MVLIRVRPRYRPPIRYTPPPFIEQAQSRFWARTTSHNGHRLWTGHTESKGRRPTITVRGVALYIHDFAYRTRWGDLWPYLHAVPTCGHELCVEPEHLYLRRAGRDPFPALTEADWDCLAELLYDRGENSVHPHLPSPYDVARVYQVDETQALVELTRRCVHEPVA